MGSVRQFRETALDAIPNREPQSEAPALSSGSSLLTSDKRYEAIFRAAAMGMLHCTLDGQIVDCNPAAERLLGCASGELRGAKFQHFLSQEELCLDNKLFQEIAEGRRDLYHVEVSNSRKDHEHSWLKLTVSLIRRADQSPDFLVVMIEDITERKQAEQQLREAQKMEAIGRLAGGIAHDFNNLLTGIMLYCDLLMTGLEKSSRLHHHAEEIRMAADHGAALIQQLLAVARQHVVESRILSINELIAGMAGLLGRLVGEDIQLETLLADDLWTVRMDPAQVKQIVMNVVLNSRDAMPDGGRIVIETRNSSERLPATDATPESQCVALTVRDEGIGMDSDTRARLFEPFFTTKAPGQGNGLGLATVYSIVKQCGGTIRVESEPGRGTEVIILLPKADQTTPPIGGERWEGRPLGNETVLLVDDNPQVRNSAKRVLSDCGYRVLEAINGTDALRIFDIHCSQIDLLVADIVMPEINGRELARQVRSRHPGVAVLFTTGYDQAPAAEPQDNQPEIFIRKPFNRYALACKVRQALDSTATTVPEVKS